MVWRCGSLTIRFSQHGRVLSEYRSPDWLICAQVHTPQFTNYGYNNAAGDDEAKMVAEGTKHAAEIGVITKADDIVCAVHAYKAGATKNVAMRFYYAGAAL